MALTIKVKKRSPINSYKRHSHKKEGLMFTDWKTHWIAQVLRRWEALSVQKFVLSHMQKPPSQRRCPASLTWAHLPKGTCFVEQLTKSTQQMNSRHYLKGICFFSSITSVTNPSLSMITPIKTPIVWANR